MTPDERQLIQGLFDRMRSNGPVEKDRDADSFINQAVRQTPDAGYLLVQSVLAQEHYLQQAGDRIQDLETRLQDLEAEMQQMQQQRQAPQRSSGGSFLGGLFGGSKPEPQPAPASRGGSVPSFGGGAPRRGPAPQAGSPWGQAAQGGGYGQQGGGFGQPPMQQQAPAGGGFMRSALTTAAGVAGGMLAANAIQGMLSGGQSANAAGNPPASGASPHEVNNDADHQRQLNAQQDAEQDQELANEQYAQDDNSSADWGASDDEI